MNDLQFPSPYTGLILNIKDFNQYDEIFSYVSVPLHGVNFKFMSHTRLM